MLKLCLDSKKINENTIVEEIQNTLKSDIIVEMLEDGFDQFQILQSLRKIDFKEESEIILDCYTVERMIQDVSRTRPRPKPNKPS